MKRLGCLFLMCAMLGCVDAEPAQADRDACIRAGHAPGTEAFDACLQALLAQKFQRPAVSRVDEMRSRMGPR